MVCPENMSTSTNMPRSADRFQTVKIVRELGLGMVTSLSVTSARVPLTQKVVAGSRYTILRFLWQGNCRRYPHSKKGSQFAERSLSCAASASSAACYASPLAEASKNQLVHVPVSFDLSRVDCTSYYQPLLS